VLRGRLPIRLLPADRSKPVRQVRPDLRGTGGHGTASGGSLTCAECSSACGWDGWPGCRRAVPTRNRGRYSRHSTLRDGTPGCSWRGRGRTGTVRAVITLMAQFRPDPRSPRVVEYVEGGRRCSKVSTPDSRGKGVRPGARTGSPPGSIPGQAGEAAEGTPAGRTPFDPSAPP
jgi:hypothetical protein